MFSTRLCLPLHWSPRFPWFTGNKCFVYGIDIATTYQFLLPRSRRVSWIAQLQRWSSRNEVVSCWSHLVSMHATASKDDDEGANEDCRVDSSTYSREYENINMYQINCFFLSPRIDFFFDREHSTTITGVVVSSWSHEAWMLLDYDTNTPASRHTTMCFSSSRLQLVPFSIHQGLTQRIKKDDIWYQHIHESFLWNSKYLFYETWTLLQ